MWKGDEVAACVAAASVIAKVTRDRIMRDLHLRYPEYGFARHKGYSTPAHMKALAAHGPCPEHRHSFVNVSSVKCGDQGPQVVCSDPGEVPDEDLPLGLGGGPDAEAAWSDSGQEN
jgi:ribonuclease HII